MQVIRSNRKTASLQVNRNAELIVRVPLLASDAEVQRILRLKHDWITQKIELMQARQAERAPNGKLEQLLYLGKSYRVDYIQDTRPYVSLQDHFIVSNLGTEQLRQFMPQWYQMYGIRYMQARIVELSKLHGFPTPRVKITKAVSKWGSCSTAGRVCFSWRLLMAAPEIIDYVIIHELSHLIHQDHSPAFWAHVQSIVPDYKKHYKWLKEHGHLLNL
ncbi:MAG: hypothetical protein CVU48_04340 [Candidatus Cloacimonetes bacterium HGW-Cloacimonetes-1]|jgi:hypothetical protein|nr:MAG: hypothetical protein CVU48_04340 [Candidatus Cloacimonetes bacterium HGW-Cloacimonetes-1]